MRLMSLMRSTLREGCRLGPAPHLGPQQSGWTQKPRTLKLLSLPPEPAQVRSYPKDKDFAGNISGGFTSQHSRALKLRLWSPAPPISIHDPCVAVGL